MQQWKRELYSARISWSPSSLSCDRSLRRSTRLRFILDLTILQSHPFNRGFQSISIASRIIENVRALLIVRGNRWSIISRHFSTPIFRVYIYYPRSEIIIVLKIIIAERSKPSIMTTNTNRKKRRPPLLLCSMVTIVIFSMRMPSTVIRKHESVVCPILSKNSTVIGDSARYTRV